ncbi:MAG: hypothetical protein LBH13_08280 [Cellulomonadaceae bacterium]|jgi:hypothetical protein|nr:hypothetical protein [Cellulomonadaceae bacterium]
MARQVLRSPGGVPRAVLSAFFALTASITLSLAAAGSAVADGYEQPECPEGTVVSESTGECVSDVASPDVTDEGLCPEGMVAVTEPGDEGTGEETPGETPGEETPGEETPGAEETVTCIPAPLECIGDQVPNADGTACEDVTPIPDPCDDPQYADDHYFDECAPDWGDFGDADVSIHGKIPEGGDVGDDVPDIDDAGSDTTGTGSNAFDQKDISQALPTAKTHSKPAPHKAAPKPTPTAANPSAMKPLPTYPNLNALKLDDLKAPVTVKSAQKAVIAEPENRGPAPTLAITGGNDGKDPSQIVATGRYLPTSSLKTMNLLSTAALALAGCAVVALPKRKVSVPVKVRA